MLVGSLPLIALKGFAECAASMTQEIDKIDIQHVMLLQSCYIIFSNLSGFCLVSKIERTNNSISLYSYIKAK